MAQNIFLRGAAPAPPGGSGAYSGGYSRRPNGTATVGVGGGGNPSPYLATGGGKGRPDTTLNYVKVIIEGEAGSLTRAEFQATAYTPGAFEGIISGIAKVGTDITVTIDGTGGGGSWSVTVYKHSFSSSKEGKWTVTAHAVGKGLELLKKDASAAPPGTLGKVFFKNGVWGPTENPATGLVNRLQWEASHGIPKIPILNAVDHGKGVPGKYVQFIAPPGIQLPSQAASGNQLLSTLTYYTLGYIVETLNSGLSGVGQLEWRAKVNMKLPGGLDLISGDPLMCLIPNGNKSDYGGEADGAIVTLIKSLLGIPTYLGTSQADVKNMSGASADPADILISYEALKGIEASMGQAAKDAASAEQSAKRSPGSNLDVEGFLAAVFNVVLEATGGYVDLVVMLDPASSSSPQTPIIVNRRGPEASSAPAGAYDDVSGNGGVRESSIKGDVPQGWQAEAFANASAANGETKKSTTEVPDLGKLTLAIGKSQFGPDACGALKSAYRKALADADGADLAQKTTKPYPIGLSLKVNGVSGVEFGQALAMSSLDGTRWGNGTTVFTVTRVVHNVSGQDWTTDIDTVARLIG